MNIHLQNQTKERKSILGNSQISNLNSRSIKSEKANITAFGQPANGTSRTLKSISNTLVDRNRNVISKNSASNQSLQSSSYGQSLQSSSYGPSHNIVKTSGPTLVAKPSSTTSAAIHHLTGGYSKRQSGEANTDLLESSKTKRVKTTLATSRPTTTSIVPDHRFSSTSILKSSGNVLNAAKLSLREKQLLKEKRVRKTGLVPVLKPATTINHSTISSNNNNAKSASTVISSLAAQERLKVSTNRRDSRYSQSHDSSSILKQAHDDSMAVDSDLMPVVSSRDGMTRTIHVARSSTLVRQSREFEKSQVLIRAAEQKLDACIESTSPKKSKRQALIKTQDENQIKELVHRKKLGSLSTNSISESLITLKSSRSSSVKRISSAQRKEQLEALKKASIISTVIKSPRKSLRRNKKLAISQDPLFVHEYEQDIYEYWKELEVVTLPDPQYMLRQTELDWTMRKTLVSWIIQVHSQFKLLPETLFLTVNLIDRTLSCKLISLSKLQLVGVTALLIASKYEEILSPSVQDLVYMTDNGYDQDEILRAERHLLSIVGYQIGYCNPLNFLKRLANVNGKDSETLSLAYYFLDLMSVDHNFIQYSASHQAAAAYFLAIKTIHNAEWTSQHIAALGYTEQHLLQCVYTLLESLKSPHDVVYEKYSASCFYGVSTAMRQFLQAKGL